MDQRHLSGSNAFEVLLRLASTIAMQFMQGSFPAGTPGNGVPKVILTVGTAFPGIHQLVNHSFVTLFVNTP